MSLPSSLPIASRLSRIIGLLSLAVALAGCSAIQLGYNVLPEMSYWWLDGYLDFNDSQQPSVREDIAAVHGWHRANELPAFIPLLQRAERMVGGELGADQVCALEPELRARLSAVRERLEPVVARHAVSFSPMQLRHLERKYAQKNRDYLNDWVRLPPEEQLDKRLKAIAERTEMLYGRLDDAQKLLLRQQLQASVFRPALVLAERQRRQQDTVAVLRSLSGQPASGDVTARVHSLFDRMLEPPDPTFRTYMDAMRQETCRIAAVMHNSTSPAQRDFAVRRLRAWQRDLSELAARR
jgi:hypothetical protein